MILGSPPSLFSLHRHLHKSGVICPISQMRKLRPRGGEATCSASKSRERANLSLPEHQTQVDTCAPIIHNSQRSQTLSPSLPFIQGQCLDAQPLDMGGGGQSLKDGIQEEA